MVFRRHRNSICLVPQRSYDGPDGDVRCGRPIIGHVRLNRALASTLNQVRPCVFRSRNVPCFVPLVTRFFEMALWDRRCVMMYDCA